MNEVHGHLAPGKLSQNQKIYPKMPGEHCRSDCRKGSQQVYFKNGSTEIAEKLSSLKLDSDFLIRRENLSGEESRAERIKDPAMHTDTAALMDQFERFRLDVDDSFEDMDAPVPNTPESQREGDMSDTVPTSPLVNR